MRTSSWFTAFTLAFALAITPALSDAKRLGGGKSSGLQRNMPARTAPDAPPPQPAQPGQPAQAQPAAPAQAAAPAAAKRSWLGPLAGIAAGLGLAALMSHLGLSEAFGNVLLLMLAAVAALFVVRWLMRRAMPQPAAAGLGANGSRAAQVSWPAQARPADAVRPAAAFVPASFDSEGFARSAKTIFVRLQAAHDAGDLDDLRRFTTPEMFAELKVDLQERAGKPQQTEVLHVDAQVLDVAEDDGRDVVSVRYSGRVREEAGAEPIEIDEVWHLVKPRGEHDRGWLIAGIEQLGVRA